MREIKFRVWGGEKMEYSIVAGALGNFYAGGIDPNDSASLGNTTKYSDQAPLMQYTGLKDKNGKEIYEGDILKRYGVGEPLTVFWKAPCFVATGAAGISHWYFDEAEAVEIIGNIYEHPHLLNHEK